MVKVNGEIGERPGSPFLSLSLTSSRVEVNVCLDQTSLSNATATNSNGVMTMTRAKQQMCNCNGNGKYNPLTHLDWRGRERILYLHLHRDTRIYESYSVKVN